MKTQSPPGTFDLDLDRQQLVSLDGPWRRQLGDDPAWSNPLFNDSSWPLVRPDQPWNEQAFSGSAWYRATIHVPANQGPQALYLYYIDDSYQVFVDGRLLLSEGGLPPHPHAYGIPPQVLALPAHVPDSEPYTLSVAIRVWLWPSHASIHRGGLRAGSRIGSPQLIQDHYENQNTVWEWQAAGSTFVALLELFASMTSLALFAFRRKEREYLWFSLLLFFTAASHLFQLFFQFHTLGWSEQGAFYGLIGILGDFAAIAFYYRLLGGKRNLVFWIIIATNFVLLANLVPAYLGLVGDGFVSIIVSVFGLPTLLWIIALIVRRTIQGYPDARLLILPVIFSNVAAVIGLVFWIGNSFGLIRDFPGWVQEPVTWPFTLGLSDIGEILFLIGMLAILIHRFTKTRLHEEAYEREREAARSVQHVLVPQEVPELPGYSVASVYRPFGEVGGDFFQILPLTGGCAIIVIGDVSGKGLPAAMTVSLLVGTVRTLVRYTASPGEILASMNQLMVGRSSGGFTTCLVVHADANGVLTIANAGHIAPFVDGKEVPMEFGLPLGLAEDVAYPEVVCSLRAGEQLTLVTDGIVEARSKSGELFGFERTAGVSVGTAEEMVAAAQAFGQDDDITALTVRLRSL